jgi:competence protein ComEC
MSVDNRHEKDLLSKKIRSSFTFTKNSQPPTGSKSQIFQARVSPSQPQLHNNSSSLISPFIPWSLPGAMAMIFGVLMAYQGLPWFGMAMSVTLLASIFLFHPKTRVLLPLLLLLPLGFVRFSLWDNQLNPVLHLVGKEQEFSGISDGKVLKLNEPKGAKVVLVSQESVKGKVTLIGEIGLAQNKRNPGGYDYAAYLRRNGIWGQLFVREVLQQEEVALSLQERLQLGITAGLTGQEAAIAEAINLGIRNELGDLRDIFAASGLAHILALSGLNIAILVTVLGFALKPLGLWRYPFLIFLVLGFLAVVEQSPSVFRAAIMACIVLFSLWRGAGKIELWPSVKNSECYVKNSVTFDTHLGAFSHFLFILEPLLAF